MTNDPTTDTDHGPGFGELMTPSQLAERWGVSVGHLANLRSLGEGIGYLKIGSRVAYRYRDVVAYENEHYVPLGSPAAS